MSDEKKDLKAPEPKPAMVAVVMIVGPGGSRPRRWMTGPAPFLRGQYDFKPCCPTDVFPEDARKLMAGGPDLGGRKFAAVESGEDSAWPPKGRW